MIGATNSLQELPAPPPRPDSSPMNLFEQAHQERMEKDAPLAARMRPRTLDEFVGQEHIVGPGRLLRRAIQADQLGSLIFYGPPGTGKTTLAQVIANTTRAHFIALNAVLSGVKEIRDAVAEAQERAEQYGQRTILFVDEVHRFNKAQQDALLPWVENGTVIFIGATTENPYFEVNKALVSRSRIFQLTAAGRTRPARHRRSRRSHDPERGYGKPATCASTRTRSTIWSTSPTAMRAACSTRWNWLWRPPTPSTLARRPSST